MKHMSITIPLLRKHSPLRTWPLKYLGLALIRNFLSQFEYCMEDYALSSALQPQLYDV